MTTTPRILRRETTTLIGWSTVTQEVKKQHEAALFIGTGITYITGLTRLVVKCVCLHTLHTNKTRTYFTGVTDCYKRQQNSLVWLTGKHIKREN